ncbi:D-glycero-alpha-D-manno-heptose-1,7-bisphosphate 7-phosphatase [Elusimicrobiota bacterium]
MGKKKRVAVFVDRDGTLMHEAHYISDPRKVRLYKDVDKSLVALRKAGFLVIILSNQSGIGRGWVTRNEVKLVNRRMLKLLRKSVKADIDAIYYCPHAPQDGCKCRKPKTMLIKTAQKRFNIDLKRSFLIGDKNTDIELGFNVGAKTILVMTGYGREHLGYMKKAGKLPDFTAHRFTTATKWILGKHFKHN